MSKYTDDFFKEYEEVYSDSKYERQQRRSSDAYSSSSDRDYGDTSDRTAYRSSYDRSSYDTPVRRTPSRPIKVQRKRRMKRKTRRTLMLTVMILIVLAVLSAVIAIATSVSGVGNVSDLQATQITAHEIVLQWNEVRKAEGYHVMMAQGDDGEFTEYQTITGSETATATVADLEQAQLYRFRVTAFTEKSESRKPAQLDGIYTLPDTPEITNIVSAKAGSIHLDWSMNEKANGFVVEYKKDGGEYSADQRVTVTDPNECRADITGLEANATYVVRVYAYVSLDEELDSLPSAEQSLQVVAQDVEVLPKAPDQQVDSAIDPNKPMIALSFDDGPLDGDSGERILDVLEQYNAKATFFMVGCNVTSHESNLKRKVQLGMELGNHTWDHGHYGDSVTVEDIRKASNEIYNISGQYPTCFRSPGGMTTDLILNECAAEGMAAYYWSIDTEDWKTRNADSIYQEVMDHVQDGDIILMHEIYDATADAVERMVPVLIEQGYQLVTCHDLITLKTGSEPVAGTQYYSGYEADY